MPQPGVALHCIEPTHGLCCACRVALLEIENMKAVEQVADHVKLQGQQKASVELILKLRGEIDALSKCVWLLSFVSVSDFVWAWSC